MNQTLRTRCGALLTVLTVGAALPSAVAAQTPSGYLTPPAPIPQILDASSAPTVLISPSHQVVAFMARSELPTIAELASGELRLGGERIDPRTNGPSRSTHFTSLAFEQISGGELREVQLPQGARLSSAQWSPDGSKLAFASTTPQGIELWVADVATAQARRLTDPILNATLGAPFEWMPDGQSLMVKRVPADRGAVPATPTVPAGPIIQQNLGKTSPARTYQDLLSSPHDERLFEYYFTSQLARVPLAGGAPTAIGEASIITDFSIAPGGQYVLVDRVTRPFSYVVPLNYFARATDIIDMNGQVARQISRFAEVMPEPLGRDMELTGPRSVSWRSDAPATVVWAEAQDEGNARAASPVRDRVVLLDAPFTGSPRTLIDLDQRYGGVVWGDADLALVNSRWQSTARTKTYAVNPSDLAAAPRVLWDRSSEDSYADPGSPVVTTNASGHRVLQMAADGNTIYLEGEGASPSGVNPFLDRYDVRSGSSERVWQSADPYYEVPVAVLDPAARQILTRRETVTEAPNYFVRDLRANTARALTDFQDPAPQLAGVKREVITYPRADGVMLSATLYTPPGYDAARDGPLPMVMWAYPREFRDAAAASQITDSPNRFSRPGGPSHLLLLTQGYAILDGPAVPIIGVGKQEPNDTYIAQLVSSMKAAVDKVVEMGVADRDRIGVGGHSYGAFMTANLLAHSDLFRAGIARSGAYNRTLTPFGFQAEPRTYWQAPEIYNGMSPFMFVDKIDEPILLTHGAADDNSGTFPVQSERLYAALKGHGATVRYVVLPLEAHGYRARESVLHTLAEMVSWMDTYVKNAPARSSTPTSSR